MDFTVTINDPSHLAGIKEARERANASLTPEKNEDGSNKPINTHPQYLATDAAYVQATMARAAESYAKSYGLVEEIVAAKEVEVAAMRAKIEAMK